MNEKAMRIIFFLSTFMMMFAVTVARADEVVITASAPSEVTVGERFRFVLSVNARPQQLTPPAFGSFRVISGPNQSSSTSTQIINNQVTMSVTTSYTYVLEATEEGEFTFANARVNVEGSIYQADPVKIKVLPRGSSPQPAAPSQPQQQQPPEATAPTAQDVFIRAVASSTEPFMGEQVIITYKLYTRIDITNYTIDALPSFQGFWSENLSGGQASVSTEVVNGINYRVAEIRRVAVFPQRSGELRIEPMRVDMNVRVRRPQQQRRGSLFDEFFGSSPFDRFQSMQHSVQSNAITMQVKPLPLQNRPASFNGAVGRFQIQARLQPEELDVNDASNLVLTIQGNGNLRMLEPPAIQFPRYLDLFDPRVENDIRTGQNGIGGSRTFDYLMIPRSVGSIDIPRISFSFFDPGKGEYVTQTIGPFSLNVTGAPPSVSNLQRTGDASFFGEDIRFIQTNVKGWRTLETLFFRSRAFYILLASPVVLLILFIIVYKRQLANKNDMAGMRIRKARKAAERRLLMAKKYLEAKETNAFYDEVFRALWGYVSDKLNIPVVQLNKENVAKIFRDKNVPVTLADKFLEGIAECEFARFSPANLENPMEESYQKALETIVTLEKELRKQSS